MDEPAILLHSMNQEQIIQIVDERIGENIARSFGLIQEWFSDQFKTMNEKIDFYQEKNERNFSLIFNEIATIKERITEISLDIKILKEDVSILKQDVLILKKDVSILKKDVAVLKQDVKKLDNRVVRLEKHYEYA